MFKGKLRKLIKKPGLFFSDMAANQLRKLGKVYVKKVEGHYQYTVVSAVYNVGRYLDDFFASIVRQKLNFKKHIHLVMVDDGSTDDSAFIIKKWQKKYPANITYLYQENAGQSCARNLGLQHVKSEWVTFIDPDDFLDCNYFYNVDNFINNNNDKDIKLLGCNIVFYIESKNIFRDNHPLSYRFKNGNHLVSLNTLEKEVQLSASTAFFKTEEIASNNVMFDNRVKPNFEDGHFIANYLLNLKDGSVGFLRDSKYYYRKREDGTSTLDTSWTKPERFLNVPEFGYLDMLRKFKEAKGYVPVYIQRTVLYEMVWYVKHLVNHSEKAAFLSKEQKKDFIRKLKEIFTYLDKKLILDFELAGAWFYHKVAMLSYFKSEMPDAQIVYVEKYDAAKNMAQLRYFTNNYCLETITLDGKDTIPHYAKTIKHDFLDETFVLERRLWIQLGDTQKLNVSISNAQSRISLNGKNYKEGVTCSDIQKCFENHRPKYEKNKNYVRSWVFMDRDIQADDNAEHLYRYVRDNYPNKKIFFALQRKSHDWERLYHDGFNLLDFGSAEHKAALASCDKVISSHANYYVTNLLGPKMLSGRHFIFLQHGVIKDDLSNWLNSKEDINCFVTSSPEEYHSICDDNTRYYHTKKEVVLTGLPRHDALLKNNNNIERVIVIMPTWRQSIVGSIIGDGDERAFNPSFMNSSFAKHWYSVLHSPSLLKSIKKYNYKVIFFPHANIEPYLSFFDVPDYIEVITHTNGSIQNLFKRASLMITDYSSVAFEMAVQGKQTIYYQFDAQEFFAGHVYSKGYFDYNEHGFGPVVTTEKELFKELNITLKNNAVPSAEILQRIEKTFPHRDGLCCERTFRAIESLDKPLPDDFADHEIYYQYALQASQAKMWPLAEQRWKAYAALVVNYDQESEAICWLTEALRKQGKLAPAQEALNVLKEKYPNKASTKIAVSYALLYMAEHRWHEAIIKWREAGQALHDNTRYCYCLYKAGDITELHRLHKQQTKTPEFSYTHLYLLLAKQEWEAGVRYLTEQGIDFSSENSLNNKLLITLSYCYQQLKMFKQAHDCLVQYENYISNDPQCRLKIARLAWLRKNWDKVLLQLDKACTDILHLPKEHLYYYLAALIKKGKSVLVYQYFQQLPADIKKESQFSLLYVDACLGIDKWQEAITLLEKMQNKNDAVYYRHALAFRKLGRISQALMMLKNKIVNFDSDTWLLRCELAQLNEDWEEAYQCWLSLMRLSPEKLPDNSADKLQNLRILREFSGNKEQTENY